MSTVKNARAIEAALAPLQGACAGGTLTVRSTGATGKVPYGAALVPIVAGGLHEEGTAFVTKNPATADGSWSVVLAGTSVPIAALHGGLIGNTAAGTQYRWDPPLTGIELLSASAAGLSGGAASGAFAAMKQLRLFKALPAASVEVFFKAQLGLFPAGLLAWESTQPVDGPMAATPAPRAARAGRGKFWFRHTWLLYIVSSRLDSEGERRREGETLRDDVIETLLDTTSARDLRVSMDPGVEIIDARLFAATPTSYVDLVRFGTRVTISHRRQAEDYGPWLKTRIRQQTAAQGASPPINLPDYTVLMPSGS